MDILFIPRSWGRNNNKIDQIIERQKHTCNLPLSSRPALNLTNTISSRDSRTSSKGSETFVVAGFDVETEALMLDFLIYYNIFLSIVSVRETLFISKRLIWSTRELEPEPEPEPELGGGGFEKEHKSSTRTHFTTG